MRIGRDEPCWPLPLVAFMFITPTIFYSCQKSYIRYHYRDIISSLDYQTVLEQACNISFSRFSRNIVYMFICLSSPIYLQWCYGRFPSLQIKRKLYARIHVSSFRKALRNWFLINASGFLFYYIRVRYSDLSEVPYINHDNYILILSFASTALLASKLLCPGLETSVPNGLATIGVYVSLIMDNHEITYPGCCDRLYYTFCASLYSFVLSLMEYYIPYEAYAWPGIFTSIVIWLFSGFRTEELQLNQDLKRVGCIYGVY